MRLLFLDCETAPNLVTTWGLFNQNISLNQIIRPGYTLCWAAKWAGQDEVHFSSIMHGATRMVKGIHALMSKADAVAHYNGNKFDIPVLQKEFLLRSLPPPAPAQQIDLLKVARKQFRLASNKLDFVAGALGLGHKHQHKGHELWLECMAKKKEAWEVMEAYNRQDVLLLEKVYERMKPWIPSHPNLSVMSDTFCCPRCASTNYQKRGHTASSSCRYVRFRCNDCGGWFRLNVKEPQQKTHAVQI